MPAPWENTQHIPLYSFLESRGYTALLESRKHLRERIDSFHTSSKGVRKDSALGLAQVEHLPLPLRSHRFCSLFVDQFSKVSGLPKTFEGP